MKDHLETLGHALAFNELLELAKSNIITEENIKSLHKILRIIERLS